MKNCERCGKEHDGSYGSGRFCSQTCAFGRKLSLEERIERGKKIQVALKEVGKRKIQRSRRHVEKILTNHSRLGKAITNSWGFNALCENLGISLYFMPVVREWILKQGIDISHFHRRARSFALLAREENREVCGRLQATRGLNIPDELVFIQNSLFPELAKSRFDNRTPEICTACGLTDVWQGKPLTLQTDHENGDPRDCRWENFRKLCPNCHTQTPTWGATKNKGKQFPKARNHD